MLGNGYCNAAVATKRAGSGNGVSPSLFRFEKLHKGGIFRIEKTQKGIGFQNRKIAYMCMRTHAPAPPVPGRPLVPGPALARLT
jgi:hypothetical protein